MEDLVEFINNNSVVQRYIFTHANNAVKKDLISLTDHYNGNIETIFKNCIILHVEYIEDPCLIFREDSYNIKLLKEYVVNNCNIDRVCKAIKSIVSKYKKYRFNYNIDPQKKGIEKLCECVSKIIDRFYDITMHNIDTKLVNILIFIYVFTNNKYPKSGNKYSLTFLIFMVICPELLKDIRLGEGNINIQYVCKMLTCIACESLMNNNSYSNILDETIIKCRKNMRDYMKFVISRYNSTVSINKRNIMKKIEYDQACHNLLSFFTFTKNIMYIELENYQSEENYNNIKIIKKEKKSLDDIERHGLLRRTFSAANIVKRSPSLQRKDSGSFKRFSIKTSSKRSSLIIELDKLLELTSNINKGEDQ